MRPSVRVTPIIGSVPSRRAASSAEAAPAPGVAPRAAGSGASPVEPAATRVLRRFRMVFNAVKTHFQQVEKTAGVGGAQLWALSVVHDEPGIGVGALARAMDVHQTTASNLVRALVEQGLVDSQRSGSDRRASQLHVTRAGARLLARAPGPFAGVLPQALARLDPQTLERLDADLVALLQLLEADRRAARIPLAEM